MASFVSIKRCWGDRRFQDVVLRLSSMPEGGENANPNPNALQQSVTDIPLFSFAVVGISEWFKARLEGAWEQPSAAKKARTEGDTQAGTHASPTIIHDTFFLGEPATVPEAVLKHAHTNEPLPEDASTLVWMAKRADYWGIQCTLDACYTQLISLATGGSLPQEFLSLVQLLPQYKAKLADHAGLHQYGVVILQQVLMQQYGNTLQVLQDSQLLSRFAQLPFERVHLWARCLLNSCKHASLRQYAYTDGRCAPLLPGAKVTIDHWNTIVLLVTAWYDAQAEPPTEEQCEQLTGVMEEQLLSLSFHLQVIPQLAWWIDRCSHSRAVERAIAIIPEQEDEEFYIDSGEYEYTECTAGAVAKASWGLSRADLQALWDDGGEALGPDTPIYFAGYLFTIELSSENADLWMRVHAAWPDILVKHGVNQEVPRPCARVRVNISVGKLKKCLDIRVVVDYSFSPAGLGVFNEFEEMMTAIGSDTPEVTVQLSRPM